MRANQLNYRPRLEAANASATSSYITPGPIGDHEATVVQSGQSIGIVGNLMYVAPEVLGGKSADARSDRYTFVIITYELLTGEHPPVSSTSTCSP